MTDEEYIDWLCKARPKCNTPAFREVLLSWLDQQREEGLNVGVYAQLLYEAYLAGMELRPTWTTDRPTEPGEYWVSLHPDQRNRLYASQKVMCVAVAWNGYGKFFSVRWLLVCGVCRHSGGDGIMTDYQKGVRAAFAILAVLCALCVLASLSGCLTAVKIGQWQRAVHSWGMDASASKACQVASADASAYLANANRTLAEAGKLTDLDSDSQAKQLVTSAALACGKVVP